MSFHHEIVPYKGEWRWTCSRGIVGGFGITGSRRMAVEKCLEIRRDYRLLMATLHGYVYERNAEGKLRVIGRK